jgi:4-amino-4-deoxy-L-arabinose transferase-like glycosyltransferase
MANSDEGAGPSGASGAGSGFYVYLTVLLVAAAVYVGCMISPPSLVDDVDAVQAQIARNMLTSGDWVTARLDGVPYLEKAPLIYWLIAESFQHFGVADWVARIPVVLAALALAWLTTAFGIWAFGARAGLYAGLCISTCFGLFLFTRILIPDVMLTGSIALSLWAFLRAIDNDEKSLGWWAFVMAASLGVSLLLKSLVGVVFPIGAALVYLAITRQLFNRKVWKALHPLTGVIVIVLIAAPWHILAAWRNPPVFAFTMRSAPGEYHGFLWFYFINEQLLRFLNMRYPRDYDTVPRLYFWLFHLLWLFPWSVYLPAVFRLNFKPIDRAGRARLLAVCWTGFILVFFTFSTTQEYYSMPCYPALALLLGSAMAAGGNWIRHARPLRPVRSGGRSGTHALLPLVESSHARRHLRGAQLKPRRVQAFARPYGGPHNRLIRIPSAPSSRCRAGVPAGSRGHSPIARQQRVFFHRFDVHHLFSGCPDRDGPVRSLSFLAAARRRFDRLPARQAHRGSSLLHFFLGLLLHQSRRSPAERPF